MINYPAPSRDAASMVGIQHQVNGDVSRVRRGQFVADLFTSPLTILHNTSSYVKREYLEVCNEYLATQLSKFILKDKKSRCHFL